MTGIPDRQDPCTDQPAATESASYSVGEESGAAEEKTMTGDWAELASQLRDLRAAHGTPSFAEIARRIGQRRLTLGAARHEAKVSRHTVYDCFRDERKRVDPPLVMEIVTALGADAAEIQRWESLLEAFQRRASAAAVVSVSNQVPDADGTFVGRESQLEVLTQRTGVYWISGMPGAGKSQLAFEAARALISDEKCARVLVADLRGFSSEGPPADPEAVVSGLLRLLGLSPHQRPATAKARAVKLTELLRESDTFLVLDDARNAEQVRAILPEQRGSSIIVTSRISPEGPLAGIVDEIQLEPFSGEESFELLRRTVGEERIAKEPAAAQDLAKAAAHLPLAVGLTASRVAARQDWTLSDHLKLVTARQQTLRLNDEVASSFSLTYRELPEDAQTMFRLLAAYPVTMLDEESAIALGKQAVQDPKAALEVLVQHHLLISPRSQRYSMHSLVRLHAADLSLEIDRPAVRDSSREGLVQHLVARAWSAHHGYARSLGHTPREPQGSVSVIEMSPEEAAAFFEDCADLLLYAAHTAADGDLSPLHHLSESMGTWLIYAGRTDEAEQLHRAALQRAATAISAQRARHDVALVLIWTGRYAEAEPLLSTLVAGPARDENDDCRVYNLLGVVKERKGETAAAKEHYLTSIEQGRSIGNLGVVSASLSNLAGLYQGTGDLQRAMDTLQESVELSSELGDEMSSARGKTNMATIQIGLGLPELAERNTREAIESFERLGVRAGIAVSCNNLARSLIEQRRFPEALEWALSGVETTRAEGIRQHELIALMNVSTCQRHLDNGAAASDYAEAAVTLSDEINDPKECGRARNLLALCRKDMGELDEARRLWEECLTLWSPELADDIETVRGYLADLDSAAAPRTS